VLREFFSNSSLVIVHYMGTFMDKLKGKGLVDKEGEPVDAGTSLGGGQTQQASLPGHALQLPVDVFQSDTEVVIYAQLAGMDMQTLDAQTLFMVTGSYSY